LAPEKADFSFLAVGDTHGNSREFTAMLNLPHAKKADLLIHLGDTISGLIGRGNYYEGFLGPIVKNWQKPYFVARGNHEGRGNAPGIFLDMVYPAGRKAYQSFLHKGVYFVILDTNDEFDSDPEFREEQAKWLLETVSGKEFREAEYRVLISHYSLNLNKAVGIRLAELWNKLPQEVRDSFDLSLAGHHHCFIKVSKSLS
jgi:predicted phosphodiesterase